MFPIVWHLKQLKQIKRYFILFSMQNVIKNKTNKLLKNYYLSQVYLFIYFLLFLEIKKNNKKFMSHKISQKISNLFIYFILFLELKKKNKKFI